MTTQNEVDQVLKAAHREQDRSHEQTIRRHEEIMSMIEKVKGKDAVHKTK
jgi:Asp-tRNA(Asn)/Glu-tRNA(Gln) amidotransferase C subunit